MILIGGLLLTGIIICSLLLTACAAERGGGSSSSKLDVEYMGSFKNAQGSTYELYYYYDWQRGAEIWIATEYEGVGVAVR